MYAEITAAIQSVKTVADLARSATSLSNYNELVSAVSDVSTRLMEATAVALASQERHSQLLAQVAELQEEIQRLRDAQVRTEKYELHKFSTDALAYKLKAEFEAAEPAHFLCAKCVDSGGHTKLQPWGSRRFKCFACETVIQVEPDPPPAPRRTAVRSPYF